jgi:hypothetical protein
VPVKLWTVLPGRSKWPPASFAGPGENWQERLAALDFLRIAAATGRQRPAATGASPAVHAPVV